MTNGTSSNQVSGTVTPLKMLVTDTPSESATCSNGVCEIPHAKGGAKPSDPDREAVASRRSEPTGDRKVVPGV